MTQTTWRCNCGSSIISEVTLNCHVLTKVTGINQYGQIIFGDHTVEMLSTPDGYVCGGCRNQIIYRGVIVSNRQELADMLKETNKPIQE